MREKHLSRSAFRTTTARAVMALALASLVGAAFAGPARADDDWRHHERYDHHDNGRHRDHHPRRVYVAPPPPVRVYAPPPVVYAPPPPPPGISLFFPIEIR